MNKKLIGFTILSVFLIFLLSACGSMSGNYLYFDKYSNTVDYIQLTDLKGNLSGTFKEANLDSNDTTKVDTSSTSLSGEHNGSNFNFKFGSISWLSTNVSGEFKNGNLIISDNNSGNTYTFKPGTLDDFNKDVNALNKIANKNLDNQQKAEAHQQKLQNEQQLESYINSINQDVSDLNNGYSSVEQDLASFKTDLKTTENDAQTVSQQEKKLSSQIKSKKIDPVDASSNAADISSDAAQVDSDAAQLSSDKAQVDSDLTSLNQAYQSLSSDYQNYQNLKAELPDYSPTNSIGDVTQAENDYSSKIDKYNNQTSNLLNKGQQLDQNAQKTATQATNLTSDYANSN